MGDDGEQPIVPQPKIDVPVNRTASPTSSIDSTSKHPFIIRPAEQSMLPQELARQQFGMRILGRYAGEISAKLAARSMLIVRKSASTFYDFRSLISIQEALGEQREPAQVDQFLANVLREVGVNFLVKDEETVDRLTGQIGVDQIREGTYLYFEGLLAGKTQEQVQQFFANYMNGQGLLQPGQIIAPAELPSLHLTANDPAVDALSQRYGYPYHRPVFQMDAHDYQVFYQKLTGHLGSNGCSISGPLVDDFPFTRGLTIMVVGSSRLSSDLEHELRHTVDPNRHERIGRDQVLEEFVAFYGEVLSPRVMRNDIKSYDPTTEQTKEWTDYKVVETDLKSITRKLRDSDLYFDQYRSEFASQAEYQAYVSQIGEVLEGLSEYYDPATVDRIILNARRLQELQELLGIERKRHEKS